MQLSREPRRGNSRERARTIPLATDPAGMEPGAFVRSANVLLRNGYSPIPIAPNLRRPLLKGWSRLCIEPRSCSEIEQLGRKYPTAGVGVACGYLGLVAVDIDTDDPDVLVAIRNVLGESAVSRRGQKGRCDFYRSERNVLSRQITDKAGKVLVDVLSMGRLALIPPSIHWRTGVPYTWLTGSTLLTLPADALPLSGSC